MQIFPGDKALASSGKIRPLILDLQPPSEEEI